MKLELSGKELLRLLGGDVSVVEGKLEAILTQMFAEEPLLSTARLRAQAALQTMAAQEFQVGLAAYLDGPATKSLRELLRQQIGAAGSLEALVRQVIVKEADAIDQHRAAYLASQELKANLKAEAERLTADFQAKLQHINLPTLVRQAVREELAGLLAAGTASGGGQ